MNGTEECGIWHHLCPVLLRSCVLWELRSTDVAGKKKKIDEQSYAQSTHLGDDNAVVLLSTQICALVAFVLGANPQSCKWQQGKEVAEKFAKMMPIWLNEVAQLTQERMQTLRAGMNPHCLWAYTVRCMQRRRHSRNWSSDSELSCRTGQSLS